MGWNDVQQRIKFWGPDVVLDAMGNPVETGLDGQPFQVNGLNAFQLGLSFESGQQKIEILAALQRVYENSPSAKSMLDYAASEQDIWLFRSPAGAGSGSLPFSFTAAIDLFQAQTLQYMGSNGRFQTEDLSDNVIHELVHAIYGYEDLVDPTTLVWLKSADLRDYNDPTFDHIGFTQREANTFLDEQRKRGLNVQEEQVGYDATAKDYNKPFLNTDPSFSYTEDQRIDIAYFDSSKNKTQDNLDLSRREDGSCDLIMGFTGSDVINGGAGNDYLYGGVGNDTISGGSGDDVIFGGDLAKSIDGDGSDTASYLVGNNDQPTDHKVTVAIDPSAVSDGDRMVGLTPIIVSDDGYGGRDRLFSIENITLSEYADTVHIGAGSQDLLKSLQKIDAGANSDGAKDILDLSQFDGKVQIKNGHLLGDGIDIKLDGFEHVKLSSGDDDVEISGTEFDGLDGGDGNDILGGGDKSSILLGGAGDDVLTAGSAGDILDGGSGQNQYVGGAGADTFVVGSGTDAANGTGGNYVITNAGDNDRLVLRLDQTLGFGNASNWTTGIVLNGGVRAIREGYSGDPDNLSAAFSTVLVRPHIATNSDGAWVDGGTLDPLRSDLGFFEVWYGWDKSESKLYVSVGAAYGNFNIEVDGFQNGQLGLNFINVDKPITSKYLGEDASKELIQNSWDAYDAAFQSFVNGIQLIDLPSPGTPIEGNAAPAIPIVEAPNYLPGFGYDGRAAMVNALVSSDLDRQLPQLVQAMASYSAGGASCEPLVANIFAASDAGLQNALAASH